jgi:Tfp pilus assembly protein PilF
VGLSDAYLSLALSEALQEALAPNEAFPKARVAAERALEIDESLGEAHASLGHIKFQYDRDWRGAELEFKRAIELTPNYAYAHLTYALCLMWMGRVDEAIAEMLRARALDPLFPATGPNLGLILARAHQYDRAIEECRKTLEFDPAFALAHYRLGQIYILSGRYAEAIARSRRSRCRRRALARWRSSASPTRCRAIPARHTRSSRHSSSAHGSATYRHSTLH